jgi:hypothetical protein
MWGLRGNHRDDRRRGVKRIVCGSIALCLILLGLAHAQGLTMDEIKGRIFDAKMLKQTFANGLKFCDELNGNNFYFPPRDRVLGLEEYHRSLESLARQQVYNPERHKPWTEEDATDRWEQVKRQATKDKENCQLVASLANLEKQLDDMEKKAAEAASDKKN